MGMHNLHSATNVNYFHFNLKNIFVWQSKTMIRKNGFILLKHKFKKKFLLILLQVLNA